MSRGARGLSQAAMDLLCWLDRDEKDEWGYDRELVHEGRTWMAGTKRIPKRVVNELILFCCISAESFASGRGMERWAINGTGRDMLVHPEQTIRHVRELLQF